MKALVLNKEVVQLEEKEFPVAPDLKWIDCDNTVKVGYSYDGSKFAAPPEPPKPTDEQLAEGARLQRNLLLQQSDWVVIKEREEGGSVSNFADWKKYRQELRDITKTYKSRGDVKWPINPS